MRTLSKQLSSFLFNRQNLELFKNPSYVIRIALLYIHSDAKLGEKLLTHAFNMDRLLGFHALYYRALAKLIQNEQIFRENNRRTKVNNDIHRSVRNDYRLASILARNLVVYYTGVLAATNNDPNSELAEQYQSKICLLNQFRHACGKAIGMIDWIDKEQPKWVAKFQQPELELDEYFLSVKVDEKKNKDDEDVKKVKDDKKGIITCGEVEEIEERKAKDREQFRSNLIVPYEEIDELDAFGLKFYYEVGYAMPKAPWWAIVLIAVIGIVEIGIGILLAVIPVGFTQHMAKAFITK